MISTKQTNLALVGVLFLTTAVSAQNMSDTGFMDQMASEKYKNMIEQQGAKDCSEIGITEYDETTGWCPMIMSGLRMLLLKTQIAKKEYNNFYSKSIKETMKMNQQNPDAERLQEIMVEQQKLDEKMFMDEGNQKKLDIIMSEKINNAKIQCEKDQMKEMMCFLNVLGAEMATLQQKFQQEQMEMYK